MQNSEEKFDVVVVGGGPAGMMTAGRAGELGAKVALVEKNRDLGRKLLITGKSRCNITNALFDDKEFVGRIGFKGKFLFSALSNFGPEEVINFFEEKKLRTKVERGRRVFPVSDRSQDVLDVLRKYLRKGNVQIFSGEKILGFETHQGKIKRLKLKGKHLEAKNFVLATGGKSYPATGSTGDGYKWAKMLGHKIADPEPSLVPLRINEPWVRKLQGLSLKNVRINIFQNNKKQDSRFGEMLFTHFGLSGPIILDVSRRIGEILKNGEVEIQIDLKPSLDYVTLDKRLQKDFETSPAKNFVNYLPSLVPKKLVNFVLNFSGIDPSKKLGTLSREERKKIVHLLKEMKVTVKSLLGFSEAIVTRGGVDLKEVDSQTMRSKIVSNLFFAGEILDLDGPSGGYNLQICWSTGYTAGSNFKF